MHFAWGTNLVKSKVLQKRRPSWVSEENAKHLMPSFWEQFLGISGVGYRLALLSVAKRTMSGLKSSWESFENLTLGEYDADLRSEYHERRSSEL
jgi:hypothetical protein